MKRIALVVVMLTACGKTHVGAESTGQVKTVTRNTPLICPDQWLADISLGVMRNGTGSMSTHDEIFRVEDPAVLSALKTAAESGALVTVTYDEDRFRWCIQTQIITSVKAATP